ncbi:MAG: hypothetical protein AAGJ55_08015 [Cyanobacteria bacterium J06555_12]
MSQPKIRHLPITDLARIAVLHPDERRHPLKQVKGGGFGPNYNPTRLEFPGIVNRQPGVFESDRDPWRKVGNHIVARSKNLREAKMNLPVARSLYDYCESNDIRAVELDGFPISFAVGPKLSAWSPALFIYPDRLTVPFLDLRQTRNLTFAAQKFIFSLQHYALRENNPDYSDVEFQIFKFLKGRRREIRVIEEGSRSLFTYEELETMITDTQLLWFDVLADREEEARRTGGTGSLI